MKQIIYDLEKAPTLTKGERERDKEKKESKKETRSTINFIVLLRTRISEHALVLSEILN